jgi:hypothetical protein
MAAELERPPFSEQVAHRVAVPGTGPASMFSSHCGTHHRRSLTRWAGGLGRTDLARALREKSGNHLVAGTMDLDRLADRRYSASSGKSRSVFGFSPLAVHPVQFNFYCFAGKIELDYELAEKPHSAQECD